MSFTDDPITAATIRKKIHITELHNAILERHKMLALDYGRYDTSNTQYWYKDNHTWYYDDPTNTKAWGDIYPKADPAHWPPNEDPDNKFRNNHIENIRTNIITGFRNTPTVNYPDFYKNFVRMNGSNGNYLSYTAYSELLTDAFGSAAFTDPTLTAGSVLIKATHINELRDIVSKLTHIWINPREVYQSLKSGNGLSSISLDAAWDAAKTDFTNASWSAWAALGASASNKAAAQLSGTLGDKGGGTNYNATISAVRYKYEFDLDFEISSMGWNILPPTSAKLLVFEGRATFDCTWDNTLHIKCVTTGETVNVTEENGTPYEGIVVDSDITAYVGSGHANEQFEFATQNEWSDADLDKARPSDPTPDSGDQHTGTLYTLWWDFVSSGDGMNTVKAYGAYVVIEPDFNYI